jgi:transcriptional regulator of arginine metabolism
VKAQRQHAVEGLLVEYPVTSQSQLVDLLSAAGFEATQATASRDLEELGAVKVRVPGGDAIYAIPELPHQRAVPEDHLRRVFSDWVVDISVNTPIVVLRTPPGSAHVVASALDRSARLDVIGSVAGDDTIMVIAAPGVVATDLADIFRQLAGL